MTVRLSLLINNFHARVNKKKLQPFNISVMPLSHWMKIKLRQHYVKIFAKIANKYDKLSKFMGEVHYEYKCITTMSSSTEIKG